MIIFKLGRPILVEKHVLLSAIDTVLRMNTCVAKERSAAPRRTPTTACDES